MTTSRIVIAYCESWDPVKRQADCRIPAATARARYAAGEPFAAVMSFAGVPQAYLRVDSGRGWLDTAFFDEAGRRVVEIGYRDFGDHLHLSTFRFWAHASADEPEFQAGTVVTFAVQPGGRAKVSVDYGGLLQTWTTVPPASRRVPRPEFGAWPVDSTFINIGEPAEFVEADDPDPASGSGVSTFPWQAPRPLSPNHPEALFTAGARFHHPRQGALEILEPEKAGLLHMPSGQVIVTDPGTFHRAVPFTIEVPPGDYPVLVAAMRWVEAPWGETPAALLRISEKPTATWELGLQPGQDERELGPDEFFGFGVDSGTGSFLDAAGAEALQRIFSERIKTDGPSALMDSPVVDPTTGANLIMFMSGYGDGSYPVWIGRDQDGGVTCLVADMCVVGPAELLTPGADETRHVPGRAVLTPETDAPPVPEHFDSGPIQDFFFAETRKLLAQRR
ncbi:hypothetical protein ABH926_004917 [Catenulispora sp. GP43]|uniref:DUF4241 domain-containing protein n=1 Tax=Catenulispora sp. GP43 TaxID=3156263 RepID=UPI00351748CE